jgi:hypothetical protein
MACCDETGSSAACGVLMELLHENVMLVGVVKANSRHRDWGHA